MKKVFKILTLGFMGLISFNSFGQTNEPSTMDNIIVTGDDFIFSIKEPYGWIGDTDIAKDFFSDIVFYISKDDLNKGGAVVQVYSFNKQDENTEKDLEYDIKNYKDNYQNLKQQDLLVSHNTYTCYSKLVYVDKSFYQYIVYVNPGPKYKSGVSIAMNISDRPATEQELQVFKQIISSLTMLKG